MTSKHTLGCTWRADNGTCCKFGVKIDRLHAAAPDMLLAARKKAKQ